MNRPTLFPFLMLTATLCFAQTRNPGLRGPQQTPDNVPSASTSYAFTLINYPGAPNTTPQGMNPSASAAKQMLDGNYAAASGTPQSGFLLDVTANSEGVTRETFQTSDISGGTIQNASGINDLGQTVGSYEDADSVFHGYELNGGVYTILNVPFSGATLTIAYGINNAGAIVGVWESASGWFGFELTGGTYTSLQVPGEPETYPQNINEKNQIVGYYTDASGNDHGFLYQGGEYTTINFPGASSTLAETVNDSGDIVGLYCTASDCANTGSSPFQGFLLSKGVFSTITVPGAASTSLLEISNNGLIEGSYTDSAGISHGFIGVPQ